MAAVGADTQQQTAASVSNTLSVDDDTVIYKLNTTHKSIYSNTDQQQLKQPDVSDKVCILCIISFFEQ